jgi:hypothetical protein
VGAMLLISGQAGPQGELVSWLVQGSSTAAQESGHIARNELWPEDEH